MKWNKNQSEAYQLQKIRNENMKIVVQEPTVFIQTFFGLHIDNGTRRIRDYDSMTMFDVTNELKVRVQMLKAKNMAMIGNHFKQQRKNENELLARLKASQ